MTFAIQVENLSKIFQIQRRVSEHKTLVEKITSTTIKYNPFYKSIDVSDTSESFWALNEVSFEIDHGDKLGIIGRNGAGKSTLLKILSQIMTPSSGRVRVNGRLASLLEVGTGFHPELTGRENIYLNGAILGMSKKQITSRFDEIVDFAEVSYFLDTPVKRYSSGMYVRLAFAIAAHLDSEILLIDEVLAVGDVLFQKKCLGKMEDVSQEGRTIIFVSHNIKAVTSLCNKGLYLSKGCVKEISNIDSVVSRYLSRSTEGDKYFFQQETDQDISMCLLEAEIINENDSQYFLYSSGISIRIKYLINKKVKASHIYLCVLTLDEVVIFGTSDCDLNQERFDERDVGVYECYLSIPSHLLNEGEYKINISLSIPYGEIYQSNYDVLRFRIVMDAVVDEYIHQQRAGLVRLNIPWEYK